MEFNPLYHVSIKEEGSPIYPDDLDWECELSSCEKCREKYNKMMKAYKEYWGVDDNCSS